MIGVYSARSKYARPICSLPLVALFGVCILLYARIMPHVWVQKYIGLNIGSILSGVSRMPVDTYSTIKPI
jgi:hypothetical protein